MKKLLPVVVFIGFLALINSAYACIFPPEAVLLNDTACEESTFSSGVIMASVTASAYGNKAAIIAELQRYKNYEYRCYVPNNQQGDEQFCRYCGIGPDATCSDFREWTKNNNVSYYDDWTCEDPGCTICRWQYVKTLSLSDKDIEIIADFMSNGYSVIRQTENEYNAFLEHANKVNEDLTTCDHYDAVAYRDGWTGYVLNYHSDKTAFCANQPFPLYKCSSISVNAIWNDLQTVQQAEPEQSETQSSGTQFQIKPEQSKYIIPIVFIALLIIVLMIFAAKYKKK